MREMHLRYGSGTCFSPLGGGQLSRLGYASGQARGHRPQVTNLGKSARYISPYLLRGEKADNALFQSWGLVGLPPQVVLKNILGFKPPPLPPLPVHVTPRPGPPPLPTAVRKDFRLRFEGCTLQLHTGTAAGYVPIGALAISQLSIALLEQMDGAEETVPSSF
jgi:hypothetical protein